MTDQNEFDRVLLAAREAALDAVARANLSTDVAPEVIGLAHVQAGICLAIQARGPEYAAKRLRALLDVIENPAVPWSN